LTDEGKLTPLIRPFGAPSPQGEGLVNNNLSSFRQDLWGARWTPHFLYLAAAIVIAIAAVAALITVAAAAEQQDQDDDPVHITATETAIATKVTHTITSTFLIRLSMPLIPWYSAGQNWCRNGNCRFLSISSTGFIYCYLSHNLLL
jgi:hypothetical protein